VRMTSSSGPEMIEHCGGSSEISERQKHVVMVSSTNPLERRDPRLPFNHDSDCLKSIRGSVRKKGQ